MKLFFALSLLASSVFAAPSSELIKQTFLSQNDCGSIVRFDQNNIYLGFGSYSPGLGPIRQSRPAKIKVLPLNQSAAFELKTQDAVADIVPVEQSLYVLTYSGLEHWDLNSRERIGIYPTTSIKKILERKQHPEAMALYEDSLIIAHGRLGVTFFDLKDKRIVNEIPLLRQRLPLESTATAITIQGHTAYVALDPYHLTGPDDIDQAFSGLIMIDLYSQSVIAELDGMDPGADSMMSDSGHLMVSFGGRPIWTYELATLGGGNQVPASDQMWSFPVKGHPTGHASMDHRYVYTCFLKPPEYPGQTPGNMYRRVPMVLDRGLFPMKRPAVPRQDGDESDDGDEEL